MNFTIKRKNAVCYYLPILLSLFLFACSASKNSKESENKDVPLQDYEKAFDPTKYDLDYSKASPNKNAASKPSSITRKNISGFRIQVVISNEFDECQQSRRELQKLFPDQKTYIVHEFPFYKLRLGNFRTRKDAESYLQNLSNKNIKSTQIVPDRIVVE
jgi:hypothetical protein